MARKASLKVYRTAIGFHDAYVAAPSQKAALEAWGIDKNLFARGAAELVTDEALVEAPLASPGTVIKRLRGSAEEQMAALPPDKPKQATPDAEGTALPKKPRAATSPKPKPKPLPSRAALEQAEAALETFTTSAHVQLADLDRRIQALADERKRLVKTQSHERSRLETERDREADNYRRKIDR